MLKKLLLRWLAPDYDRTKKENSDLKNDLYYLTMKDEDPKAIEIKLRWFLLFSVQDAVFFGDVNE